MKIAVILTGLYRGKNPDKNVEELQNKFDCDMYFHTWLENQDEIPEQFKIENKFYTCSEPKIEYHPIFDTEPTTHPKNLYYKETKTHPKGKQSINGNKQILGYADAYRHIPCNYDIYIRTRYDTRINLNFNFKEFYDIAINEGPVGFMTRNRGPYAHNYLDNEYKLAPKNKIKKWNNDWWDRIADQMIIHSNKHFDPEHVFDLHNKKQLLSGEFGWWQVMSKPYGGEIHTSVYGGVSLQR